MGTRSTIKFYDEEDFICAVYQQFDGYLEGVGKDLKKFVLSKSFVNGIGKDANVFNGFGCFIAQFVKEFKTAAGGLYMTNESDEQEYNYTVKKCGKVLEITCAEVSEFNESYDILAY